MNVSKISIYSPDGKAPQINSEDREIINFVNNSINKNAAENNNSSTGDVFTRSKNTNPKSNKIKKEIGKAAAAYTLGIITATGIFLPKVQNNNQADTPYVTPITVTAGSTYETIAKLYDSDPRAIMAFNRNLYSDGLTAGQKIDIPRLYSNLDEEISTLQQQLKSNKLNSQERKETEIQLSKMMKKRNLQENIATTFTDGKYVYFIINNLDETSSEQLSKIKTKNGIPVETFEKIFDITEPNSKVKKPEILKRNDNFSYMYETISQYVTSGKMFYIPIEAIATGTNVNLNF